LDRLFIQYKTPAVRCGKGEFGSSTAV